MVQVAPGALRVASTPPSASPVCRSSGRVVATATEARPRSTESSTAWGSEAGTSKKRRMAGTQVRLFRWNAPRMVCSRHQRAPLRRRASAASLAILGVVPVRQSHTRSGGWRRGSQAGCTQPRLRREAISIATCLGQFGGRSRSRSRPRNAAARPRPGDGTVDGPAHRHKPRGCARGRAEGERMT